MADPRYEAQRNDKVGVNPGADRKQDVGDVRNEHSNSNHRLAAPPARQPPARNLRDDVTPEEGTEHDSTQLFRPRELALSPTVRITLVQTHNVWMQLDFELTSICEASFMLSSP